MPRVRGIAAVFVLTAILAGSGTVIASQATPAADVEREPVFIAQIERGARAAVTLHVARLAYAAGEAEEWMDFDGPAVIYVESGALTAQIGSHEMRPVAAGEHVVVPPRTLVSLLNEGSAPTAGLIVGFLASDVGQPAGFVAAASSELWPLLAKSEIAPFETPATVTTERVSIPPGETLDYAETVGVASITVESGTLMATLDQGQAEYSSGAFLRTGAVGPGAVYLGAGSERRLRQDANLLVRPGAMFSLRNEGDEPASLFVLHFVSGAPAGGELSGATPTT